MLSLTRTAAVLFLFLSVPLFSFINPDKLQTIQPPITSSDFDVRLHPNEPFYVGDLISIEVFSHPGVQMQGQELSITLELPQTKMLGSAKFEPVSGNQFRATLQWAWDTHDLSPGIYELRLSVAPAGAEWLQSVTLEAVPPGDHPHWINQDSNCCRVHLISGTAAERDQSRLLPEIEDQVRQVEAELHHPLSKKIDINLIPIVLGQSGFTTDQIYVSYTDQNYTDTNFLLVLHHELVHIVDADMGGDLRPLILVEGLAVYVTGGHYRQEPLSRRAAALPDIGRYIPLTNLADNFYSWQHEIGYLEAGSLLEYMVRTWGWDAFNTFYRDIHPVKDGSESQAFDKALQAHFGITLRQLDDRFLLYLQSFADIPQLRDDVQLTADLFDTIRLFQQEREPSAYFQQVWLPDAAQMRARGIVADYLPRRLDPQDAQIESILIEAGDDWLNGNQAAALNGLSLVNINLRK